MDLTYKKPEKLIVIDLDGATFNIVKPMVEEGRLPNFKKLMEEGVHGLLQSTIPAITPCAYSSFITGKKPQNTGIFDFVQKSSLEARLEPVNSSLLHGVPFWEIMNHFGKKVGIINLPMTFPVSHVDGFMVGCGLTACDASQEGFLHPPDLFERNQITGSTYILKPEWRTMRYRSKKKYQAEVIRMFEARSALALNLMKKEPWDFFLVHIHAIDWIQHSLWNERHMVYEIYEKVDRLIGTILHSMDENTNIMVMSDHGFGQTHRTLNLSNWLSRHGYLKTRNISFEEICIKFFRKFSRNPENWTSALFKKAYGRLPAKGRACLDSSITWLYENVPLMSYLYSVDYMRRIDWSRTGAFTYGQIGAVYMNSNGDPAVHLKLRDSIMEKLYELRDENGESLVQRVFTKEELFPGNHEHIAPDLLIWPKKVMYFHPDFDLRGVIRPPVRWRRGNHAREGIFIARGENIKKGEFIGPVNIYDLTPTMLYSMGLPVLGTMDGKIAKQCFTSSYLETNRPLFIEEEILKARREVPFNAVNERIKEELKGLGYI